MVEDQHQCGASTETESRGIGKFTVFREFNKSEGGSLIVFSLFMLACMLLAVGLAIDVLRYEIARTKLQNTLDRAVLAAADMDQTLTPTEVVTDYFERAGLHDVTVSVNVQQGINFRTVSADTETGVASMFLNMVGINTLTSPAVGTAEERVSNVEISLVVDISGSMGSNNKIQNLRSAAQDFVDTVLREDSQDLISLSLVPYTAQVNAGPDIFYQLRRQSIPNHNYSHCIDFDPTDFETTGLSYTKYYKQMQHFEWSASYSSPITNPGCPMRTYERVVPLSQNATALKATIASYRARANTAIHIGMKWGTALLDPNSNALVQNLVSAGVVDTAFNTRPAAWDDDQSMKVVVLMTDGENVDTYRIEDWAYNSSSEYKHWNKIALWRYLYNYVSSHNRHHFYDLAYSSEAADGMLSNICNAAKDAGITVFTIGFEVTNHSATVMSDCASSPSHFFRVEGLEISEAFNAIARQINQLRLTN